MVIKALINSNCSYKFFFFLKKKERKILLAVDWSKYNQQGFPIKGDLIQGLLYLMEFLSVDHSFLF